MTPRKRLFLLLRALSNRGLAHRQVMWSVQFNAFVINILYSLQRLPTFRKVTPTATIE